MVSFLARRLVQSMFVVLGVITLLFLILRLSGDPVLLLVGPEATPEAIEELRRNLGLARPIYVQYLTFLARLARGDLGTSIRFNAPCLEMVVHRIPASLELAFAASVVATGLAVPLGVVAAVKRGSIVDRISMFVSLLGQSVPTFWLGIMAILFFSVAFKIFPTSGRGSFRHLILPSLSLGTYSMARIARLTRSAMLDVLGQDYLRTARSKGLTERVLIYRHALRNAWISIVTMVAYTFATLVGGAIIIETVFAWPGVGRLMVVAVSNRDYPLAQACVLFVAIFVTIINLLADIVYVALDPRIRLGQ